jgi:hypothetical protein
LLSFFRLWANGAAATARRRRRRRDEFRDDKPQKLISHDGLLSGSRAVQTQPGCGTENSKPPFWWCRHHRRFGAAACRRRLGFCFLSLARAPARPHPSPLTYTHTNNTATQGPFSCTPKLPCITFIHSFDSL